MGLFDDDWVGQGRLRLGASGKLFLWKNGRLPDNTGEAVTMYPALAQLLELKGCRFDGWSKEHERVCKMLMGPHGRTIYKMLLIKKGNT